MGLRRSRNFGDLHHNSAGAIRVLQVLHLRAVAAKPPVPTRATWRCVCGQAMVVLRRRMPALHPETHDDASKGHPTQTLRANPPDKPDPAPVNTSH